MLLILDSLDRSGKDTQISLLQKWFYCAYSIIPVVIHCQSPFCKIEDSEEYQRKFYNQLMLKDIPEFLSNKNKILILNRSHLGEIVWSKYRNYSGDYVFEIEKEMIEKIDQENIFLFYFKHHDKFIEQIKDDGQSMFKNLEERKDCHNQFEKAFKVSAIQNKFEINVSSDCGWFPKETILKSITTKIVKGH